jgi:hypothetical protein
MRVIAVIIMLLGLASLALGVLFIMGSIDAEDEVAESIQPLPLAQLDAKYDEVKAKQAQIKMAEEPQIQAGQAQPSAMYNYLTIQRTALGLARTNVGVAQSAMTGGIVNVVLGVGLILAGVGIFRKA